MFGKESCTAVSSSGSVTSLASVHPLITFCCTWSNLTSTPLFWLVGSGHRLVRLIFEAFGLRVKDLLRFLGFTPSEIFVDNDRNGREWNNEEQEVASTRGVCSLSINCAHEGNSFTLSSWCCLGLFKQVDEPLSSFSEASRVVKGLGQISASLWRVLGLWPSDPSPREGGVRSRGLFSKIKLSCERGLGIQVS